MLATAGGDELRALEVCVLETRIGLAGFAPKRPDDAIITRCAGYAVIGVRVVASVEACGSVDLAAAGVSVVCPTMRGERMTGHRLFRARWLRRADGHRSCKQA